MDDGLPGTDQDLLHERPHEGPGLGDLARAQKLAHVLGEGRDGVGPVEQVAALRQHSPRLLGGNLQLLLAVAVLLDAVGGVGEVEVRALDEAPDALHLLALLRQLQLDALQPLALLSGNAVHLLVQHAHEVADVGLGEDVVPYLADDGLLETLGVEPGGLAGLLSPLDEGLADVVGVAAALRLGSRERLPAALAPGQAAKEVGAGGAPGVDHLRGARLQQLVRPLELVPRDDRREGVLDAHGRSLVLAPHAPDEGSRIGLVGEHAVDRVLRPAPAAHGGNALLVEDADDVEDALAPAGHPEDAAHDGVGRRVEVEAGALLGAVLDVDPAVAVGDVGGDPEAARGRLAHPPDHFLGKIFAIELVDALDDRLHELARGRVVGVLRDGDDADAAATEHRLEGDGVLALAGEAGELPDEDLLEGSALGAGLVQHPAELGPVGDAPALGLVDVLAHDEVVVLLRVVTQRPKLGGDGEVDILAVAGDAGVEGGGRGIGSVRHQKALLVVCGSA
ncbi:MAG: hypothetical protein OXI51_09210 [Chloroflexota bacterium]|nr:hypothetical protein [Chloroflexota bacterium]